MAGLSDIMNMRSPTALMSTGFALVLALAAPLRAAEITVLASNGVKAVLDDLAPRFETETEDKLILRFAPAAELKASIDKGDTFDVTILTATLIDDLIEQGRLDAATRADIARSGVGVAIKKGAPKPNIATADAFKRTLLVTRSIAYVAQGATAANLRGLFERLGVADAMKAKTRLLYGVGAADAVASGEAELGFTQISEILPVAGAELAGPLPPEIQIYTVFPAAVSTSARQPAAAQRFIKFLTAPSAVPVIKAKGMDPGL